MKTWADKATRSCFSFLKWKKNSWCNSQVYMFVTRPNPERFWTNSGFALWHFKPATCNFTANVWCGVGSWHRSYIDHAVVPSVCVCVYVANSSQWVNCFHLGSSSSLTASGILTHAVCQSSLLSLSHTSRGILARPSFFLLLFLTLSLVYSHLQSGYCTVYMCTSKGHFWKKKMLKKRKCQAAVQSNDTK